VSCFCRTESRILRGQAPGWSPPDHLLKSPSSVSGVLGLQPFSVEDPKRLSKVMEHPPDAITTRRQEEATRESLTMFQCDARHVAGRATCCVYAAGSSFRHRRRGRWAGGAEAFGPRQTAGSSGSGRESKTSSGR